MNSSISDYLEEKFKACKYDLAASFEKFGALQQALKQGRMSQEAYNEASEPFFEYNRKLLNEKKRLSKQRLLIEQDIEEDLDTKRSRYDEPDVDFYERAYRNSILPRVMSASSAKHTKSSFDTKRFKTGILETYNAVTGNPSDKKNQLAWCHVTHRWYPRLVVKAAHLVPKSLSLEEIGYLFGADRVSDDFFYDYRLGITLHQKIEEALDTGAIVIVPKPVGSETRWECILVDKTNANRTAVPISPKKEFKWNDLHHRELKVRSDNRPARRFLYFRFIITVLHAKRMGNEQFIAELQEKDKFWPTPGPYLQRATLISLARNISGFELPESIYSHTTFSHTVGDQDPSETAMILASDLRAAYVESAKRAEKRLNVEEEETETSDDSNSEDGDGEMDVDG